MKVKEPEKEVVTSISAFCVHMPNIFGYTGLYECMYVKGKYFMCVFANFPNKTFPVPHLIELPPWNIWIKTGDPIQGVLSKI